MQLGDRIVSRYRYAQLIQLSIYVCWLIFFLIGFHLIDALPAMYFAFGVIALAFTARCGQCGQNIFNKRGGQSGMFSMDTWARPSRICLKCNHDNGA